MGTAITPNEGLIRQAREMRQSIAARGSDPVEVVIRAGRREVPVPGEIEALLYSALEEVAAGRSIEITVVDDEVSTQIAADMLNVSRPYLIDKLLKLGILPFRQVGTHRRIPRAAVLAYREQQDRRSREAMTDLARLSREMDLE
jgi:excisionase family DNA binding protein